MFLRGTSVDSLDFPAGNFVPKMPPTDGLHPAAQNEVGGS